jgi:hypothetical protein
MESAVREWRASIAGAAADPPESSPTPLDSPPAKRFAI